jgi:hypothetical protein
VVAGGLIRHGEGVNPLVVHGVVDCLQITASSTACRSKKGWPGLADCTSIKRTPGPNIRKYQ